eukprot:m.170324 g.170324  ORF g.170324 m.170324 type:complete len:55 (+) comp10378_c0_seq2:259-423(+)
MHLQAQRELERFQSTAEGRAILAARQVERPLDGFAPFQTFARNGSEWLAASLSS